MRDFFKNLLKDLETLTGFQQYNRLQQSDDGEERCIRLLDELEKAANRFGNIPDNLKQKRLERAIYQEGFTGITPRWVFIVLSEYWHNTYRQIYEHELREKERKELEQDGEVSDEKRQEYIKKFKEQIDEAERKFGSTHKTKYAGTRIKESWNKK